MRPDEAFEKALGRAALLFPKRRDEKPGTTITRLDAEAREALTDLRSSDSVIAHPRDSDIKMWCAQ